MLTRARIYNIQDVQDTIWSCSAQNEPEKSQYLTQEKNNWQMPNLRRHRCWIIKNFKAAIINQTLSSKGEYIWNEWKTRMSVKKWIHKKNQMEIQKLKNTITEI